MILCEGLFVIRISLPENQQISKMGIGLYRGNRGPVWCPPFGSYRSTFCSTFESLTGPIFNLSVPFWLF